MTGATLTIRSRLGDYPVRFAAGDFGFLDELAALPHPVLLADRKVYDLYREHWIGAFGDRPVYLLEAREENKTLEQAADIYEWIIDRFAARKNLNFISVGGGITQDVSGFVASTLFRGVAWHFVPTTLLAQVDSCIGGKTSLNFRHHKNLVGTFYPPRAVYIASRFTETLSPLELAGGYGEIIKFLLMRRFEMHNGEDVAGRLAAIVRSPARLPALIR